jgi:hypothetical protein
MRKPYCKMSLKDLLDLLNSTNQDQGEEVNLPVQPQETIPVYPIDTLKPTQQIDLDAQTAAILHGGLRVPVNN